MYESYGIIQSLVNSPGSRFTQYSNISLFNTKGRGRGRLGRGIGYGGRGYGCGHVHGRGG